MNAVKTVKTLLKILAVACLPMPLCLGCLGCGTNLSEEARLADARRQCAELQPPSGFLDEWEVGVALLRTFRDDGMLGSEATFHVLNGCKETYYTAWAEGTCFDCSVLMIDAVWP